ncbi:hypothetical protein ACNIU2_26595, partial [Escherichia coli]
AFKQIIKKNEIGNGQLKKIIKQYKNHTVIFSKKTTPQQKKQHQPTQGPPNKKENTPRPPTKKWAETQPRPRGNGRGRGNKGGRETEKK